MKTTRDSLAEIVTAEPNKYSQAELGRMLGVSRERVHKLVKKFDSHHLVRLAYPARNGAAKDTAHEGGCETKNKGF